MIRSHAAIAGAANAWGLRGKHWIDRAHQQAVFVDTSGDAACVSWGVGNTVLLSSDGALLDAGNLRAFAALLNEIAAEYGL